MWLSDRQKKKLEKSKFLQKIEQYGKEHSENTYIVWKMLKKGYTSRKCNY